MALRTSGKSIIANSSWNVGANIAYTILSLLSAPLYLRHLGISQYGIFVLLNSVIAPLGLLNMGMGQAAVKYIAEALAQEDTRVANAFLQSTFLTTAALGTAGVLGVSMAANVLTARVFSISHADQQIARAAVPWVAVTWLLSQLALQFTAVPTAMQKYSIVSTGTTLCGALTMGLGLVALWMGGNLLTVLEVRAIATLATVFGWFFVAKQMLPSLGRRWCVTRVTWSRCMHFGVWQSVASIGAIAANNSDKALLGMYLSDVAVGVFAIPQTIVSVTYSLIMRAGDVLLPAVSEIDSSRGRDHSFMLTIRVGWVLSLIAAVSMGCLVVMGDDLLRLYVGRELAASCGRLLALIAVTAIASSSSVALSQYLLGIADTKRTALIAICSGVVGVVGGVLLIPRFGLNGAAVSDATSIMLVRPVMNLLIWRDGGRKVPLAAFASFLYGPALISVPVSLALRAMRISIGGECGWLGLALWGAGCSMAIGGAVVIFDRFLPEWKQRQSDSGQVLMHVWKIRKRTMHALVAFAGR